MMKQRPSDKGKAGTDKGGSEGARQAQAQQDRAETGNRAEGVGLMVLALGVLGLACMLAVGRGLLGGSSAGSKDAEGAEGAEGAADWDLFAERSRVPGRMVTEAELGQHTGADGGAVWVGIAGIAVDVSAGGRRVYGPGGAYAHFAGRDGTRAFATGEYTAEGLRATVAGLGPRDVRAVAEWVRFYLRHPSYRPVGRIPGEFYAQDGSPRPSPIDAALAPRPDPVPYPTCNSRWAGPSPAHPAGHGAVWCTPRSGLPHDATPRSWAGVPRRFRYVDPDDLLPASDPAAPVQDSSQIVRTRCVCVPTPQDAAADPRIAQYPGCPEDAIECPT